MNSILKCPHCRHELDRIYEVRTSSDILYFKKKEGCYYWAKSKEEIIPKDVLITSDEMEARIGFEPEFSSTMYLCPYCFYTIPSERIDSNICTFEDMHGSETKESN